MSIFRYHPADDVELTLRARLACYPRVDDITWDGLRALFSALARVAFRAQFRLVVSGAWPHGERIAYVANHQSHLDTIAILSALPASQRRGLVALAAKDYFFEHLGPALGASLFAQAVAFDRLTPLEARRWARLIGDQPRGRLLVYPSGSRRSHRVHPGLLFILARCGWQIVPLRLEGTAAAWPVGARVWRPFRTIRVSVEAPLAAAMRARDLASELERIWEGR